MTDINKLRTIVSESPYSSSTCSALEEYVTSVADNKCNYSFDLIMSLLRNYQINISSINQDVAVTAMILALMHLPSTDYLEASYILPKKISSLPSMKLIQTFADQLERGQYVTFWEEYSNNTDVFKNVQQFSNKIRSFILSSLANTYQSIQKDVYGKHLGLTNIDEFNKMNSSYINDCNGHITFNKQ